MNTIINDIKSTFKNGDVLIKLIYVNLGVFLLFTLIKIIGFISQIDLINPIFHFLALPSSLASFVVKPWTIFTHFFFHTDFFHLLSNFIWLYFFGKLFNEYLGSKRLLATYFLGGLSGAILYIALPLIAPVFQQYNIPVIGASASIIAIVLAITTHIPNFQVPLPLIGNVKIKYISIFYILLNLSRVPSLKSAELFIHLGGAIFGYIFIKQYQKDNDLSKYFYSVWNFITAIFKSKPKIKVAYSNTQQKTSSDYIYNENKVNEQKIIDQILDKISKSGYESLSKQEKEILFSASKKK